MMPWWGEWQPTPVLLPGKPQGQRSLAVYCPWDGKELDTTERLTLNTPTCLEKVWWMHMKVLEWEITLLDCFLYLRQGVSTKIQKMHKTGFLLFKKLTIRIRMKDGFMSHAITIWLTVGSGCLECVLRKCWGLLWGQWEKHCDHT